MNEFTFEATPWELFVQGLEENGTVGAAQLLTLLEGESEEAVEDAFADLEDLTVSIDLSDLPRPAMSGQNGLRLKREADLVAEGKLMERLEETDPLRLYLEEVASIPVCGDIHLLAEDLSRANRTGGDSEKLRMAIVNLSLSRVIELAGKYTGWGVMMLDLIQEGSMGLWNETGCFVGRGADFEILHDWWIEQYMIRAIVLQARSHGVGHKMRQALEDFRAVDERLLGDLGRNATIEEIARELHMSLEETTAVARMLENARRVHKAKADVEPPEETEEDERHVEDTALFRMRQRIMDLLSVLSKEDAQLLNLRFGLEGGRPLSPAETGRKLGLTPEEVVAREAAALSKLRETN